MTLQWLGQSCFKIQSKKPGEKETLLITDPYSSQCGLKKPRLNADIVTLSIDDNKYTDANSIKGSTKNNEPFVIKNAGEYEVSNIFIHGINFHPTTEEKNETHPNNTIYVITADDITLTHLGHIKQTQLNDDQLEKIESTDILLIPIGGKYTIDAKQAATLVSQIEPRIIIPMHYKIPGLKVELNTLQTFIKEMGNKKEEIDKLKINKKDLPQEDSKLIILKK